MKVILTDEAIESLETLVLFLAETRGELKALSIGRTLVSEAMALDRFPMKGPIEPLLESLNKGHRRIIFSNRYKIIYKVEDAVYITDFFDTHQDPSKMKG